MSDADFLKATGLSQGDLDADDQSFRYGTKEDPTFGGARLVGDSSALAKARYDKKAKTQSFADWKKGREAQHLIPASLHKSFPALTGIVDSAQNGMMLPTEKTAADPSQSPVFTDPAKQVKPIHRRGKNRDHPTYTRNVHNFLDEVTKLPGKGANQSTLGNAMDALRQAHKDIGGGKHVDDISVDDMKDAWNTVHGKTFS